MPGFPAGTEKTNENPAIGGAGFPKRYGDLFILVLAFLVGNGAGSLASRLAGGLALAAAALGSALFKIGVVNSLYVFHFLFVLSKMIILLKFKF